MLRRIERRGLLRAGLSLGALTMLTGCDLQDGDAVDRALGAVSRLNDRVQAWLFDPNRLAPTYPASAITTPFPFNAFYPAGRRTRDRRRRAGRSRCRAWCRTGRRGRCPRLRAMPQEGQITRHICIEGWSAIGSWSGVPFRSFLERIGADTRARYVGFKCADRYYSSIDMATALHPQTILALDYGSGAAAAGIRLSRQAARADKARLQEPEAHRRPVRDQRLPGRLLGRPGLQLVQRLVTRGAEAARQGREPLQRGSRC